MAVESLPATLISDTEPLLTAVAIYLYSRGEKDPSLRDGVWQRELHVQEQQLTTRLLNEGKSAPFAAWDTPEFSQLVGDFASREVNSRERTRLFPATLTPVLASDPTVLQNWLGMLQAGSDVLADENIKLNCATAGVSEKDLEDTLTTGLMLVSYLTYGHNLFRELLSSSDATLVDSARRFHNKDNDRGKLHNLWFISLSGAQELNQLVELQVANYTMRRLATNSTDPDSDARLPEIDNIFWRLCLQQFSPRDVPEGYVSRSDKYEPGTHARFTTVFPQVKTMLLRFFHQYRAALTEIDSVELLATAATAVERFLYCFNNTDFSSIEDHQHALKLNELILALAPRAAEGEGWVTKWMINLLKTGQGELSETRNSDINTFARDFLANLKAGHTLSRSELTESQYGQYINYRRRLIALTIAQAAKIFPDKRTDFQLDWEDSSHVAISFAGARLFSVKLGRSTAEAASHPFAQTLHKLFTRSILQFPDKEKGFAAQFASVIHPLEQSKRIALEKIPVIRKFYAAFWEKLASAGSEKILPALPIAEMSLRKQYYYFNRIVGQFVLAFPSLASDLGFSFKQDSNYGGDKTIYIIEHPAYRVPIVASISKHIHRGLVKRIGRDEANILEVIGMQRRRRQEERALNSSATTTSSIILETKPQSPAVHPSPKSGIRPFVPVIIADTSHISAEMTRLNSELSEIALRSEQDITAIVSAERDLILLDLKRLPAMMAEALELLDDIDITVKLRQNVDFILDKLARQLIRMVAARNRVDLVDIDADEEAMVLVLLETSRLKQSRSEPELIRRRAYQLVTEAIDKVSSI